METVFNLNNPKAEKSPIRCCLSINGKRYRSQVGISVVTKFWDKNKSRVKVTNSYRDAVLINHKLAEWDGAVNRVLHNTTLKNIDISDEKVFWSYVQCEIKNEPYILGARNTQSFTDYIENVYIPRFRGRKDERRLRRFKSVYALLKEYEEHTSRTINFNDVNVLFYRDFSDFCYKEKKYTINYFGTLVKIVKQFMREAVEIDRLSSNHDYRSAEFKAPSAAVDSEYLTVEELEALYRVDIDKLIEENYPLSFGWGREQLRNTFTTVRNLFLIGAFTGLRVSDFTDLKDYNFRDGKMVKITEKDNDRVVIPIHPLVQNILDGGFDYSAKVSEKTMRDYIKILCRFAGFTQNVEVRRTTGGVVKSEVYPRYRLISTHTCRRSFATNAVIAGIPVAHIMMITGHTRETDFWRYVRIKPSQIADLVADSKFFKR